VFLILLAIAMQDEIDCFNFHPSSSLRSPGTTPMPLTCVVPPGNLNRPIFHSTHSSISSSSSSNARTPALPVGAASAAAPFSKQSMGQNQSTLAPPSAGQKFRRAFSRRKKSEDISKEVDHQLPPPSLPFASLSSSPVTKLFGYRKASLTSTTSHNRPLSPPPLPSQPLVVPAEVESQPPIEDHLTPDSAQAIRQEHGGDSFDDSSVNRLVSDKKSHTVEQVKEDWRKSDSTMTSLNTIRPGATNTSPDARPVSVAESSHSTNTIMAAHKRVSMLMTDAELTTTEDKGTDTAPGSVAAPRPQSPTSSLQTQHRRSVSLKLGTVLSFTSRPSLSQLRIDTPDGLLSATPPLPKEPLPVSYPSDMPTVNKTAAEGFISPMNSHTGFAQPTGNQVHGRLAAWTTASVPPTSLSNRLAGNSKASPSFRQTAVSISGSIAPAAMDLGKRAMERMGRAWGYRGTGSSLGHGSHPSDQSLSSSKRRATDAMTGRHPNDSIPSQINSLSTSRKGKRRTPNAPSGSWSISSTSSVSVSETDPCPALAAINSSKYLRGPLSSSGGLVFGRRLAECVRDTAIDEVRLQLISGEYFGEEAGDGLGEGRHTFPMRPLEQRLLPAVVVRCVQHLLTWGVQEEGLFRCVSIHAAFIPIL
jgi:hypothetical protein